MKSIVNSLFTSPTHFALVTFLILVATMVVIGTPRMSSAESPTEAISRIRRGAHAQMPPPQTTYATGPVGRGLIMSEAALGAYRTAIMIEPDINGVSGILPAHLASVLGIPTNMTLVPAMAVATLSVIVPSLFALSSYGIYPLAMFLAATALSGPIIALHLVRGLLGIMTEAIPRIAEIVDEVINLLSVLWSLFRHGAQSLHEKLLEAKRKRGLCRQLQKYMEAERRLKCMETNNLLRRRWEVQRQLEHYLKGGK